MDRCKQCIMPSTVPGITFNQDGVCSYCLSYREEKIFGAAELEKIISRSRNNNKRYDCIVPLSGGRDSSYVLYMAKALYNLKVLAVNYDNEYRNDQALINMQRACSILGIDLVSVRSKRSIANKIVKHNLRASQSFGEFGTCIACMYGYRSAAYRAAEQHGVPLIFWGESKQEATQDMERKAFEGLKMSGSKYAELLNVNFYLAEYYRLLQRLEFPVKGNPVLSRADWPVLRNNDIKEIKVFDYIQWDREQIKRTITKELKWEKPESHTSTWRTDCLLHAFVNYTYYKLFGCTKDCFGYCKMINSGKMDRKDALKQEEQIIATFDESIREILKDKIGLTRKEVERIEKFSVQAPV